MKRLFKSFLPATYWQILRHLKSSPGLIWDAFDYYKMYGLQETWKKIKKTTPGEKKGAVEEPASHNRPLPDYVVSEPAALSETGLSIAVVVHVFYLDMMPEILRRLLLIPYKYSLYFTVSQENKPGLLESLKTLETEYEVVVCANYGYDVAPFLYLMPRLKAEGVDVVCKIHTKKGTANLGDLIEGVGDLWFNMLIEPLLGSTQTIKKVIKAFEADEDIGMLGSASLYKSAQRLMYDNELSVSGLVGLLDKEYDPAQDWGFFAGSMFWARMAVFQPVIDQYELLNDKLSAQHDMQTGVPTSVFHAMERVFGALPQMTGQRVALSFSIDKDKPLHAIYAPSDIALYFSPFTLGMTLQNEYYLSKNYVKLHHGDVFDPEYYSQTTPLCTRLQMDPLLHFLRYGVYLNQAPNHSFSPFTYWDENPDVLRKRFNPLVHFSSTTAFNRKNKLSPIVDNDDAALKIIKKSGLFNPGDYLRDNPDVIGMNPLEHYCRYGWKEGRSLKNGFDSRWYQREYLRGLLAPVNPLLHYLLRGKRQGLKPQPVFGGKLPIQTERLPKCPKRVCLFAAYDPDGLIDETAVAYVKELSRHADVYFLSDASLQHGQLDKLSSYVKGAWDIRHGEYDFGSYKRLAKYLVGWDNLAQYDEILLVNDSSYLIRPLDAVFEKMNTKQCSWWGMQATKGMTHTRERQSNQFTEKIPMPIVKRELLQAYIGESECDFHVGSYFLAFRKPVVESGELRQLLDSVKQERSKKELILNNEIGFTRRLICGGYDFDTYMDDLYPFHPVYSNQVFEMIREGFPLFKRFFLSENHYHVSELWKWKERLLESVPNLDVESIELNLHRVVDAEKLFRNLHREESPQKLMSHGEFVRADKKTPKDKNCWAFPVCAYDHMLTGNDRAVFEEVKNDPNIKKIILFRSKQVLLEGKNVHIVPLESLEGQRFLIESGVVFIKHTVRENVMYPLDAKRRKFINLWHGIPLKRIGVASIDHKDVLKQITREHDKLHCVISSSSIDRLAMTAGFYPLLYDNIWVTGLPRNDFILREEALMPEDFQQQRQALEETVNGERLVLFAPTFRNGGEGYYTFSGSEIERIHAWLEENNLVMGVREHMAAGPHSYYETLRGPRVINAGMKGFPNIEVLYRKADLLITDYSSCFIDFMLTGKQMISFAYDYKNYSEAERGLFYDLDFVFPGPVCYDFESLMQGMTAAVASRDDDPTDSYHFKRKIFFDYIDDQSSARLVRRIIDDKGGRQDIL